MKLTSWQTTLAGVATILAALANYFTTADSPDLATLITAVLAGVGLIVAKDKGVTGGTIAATPEATDRIDQPPPAV